jgi:GeoRSP system PqqD family protein
MSVDLQALVRKVPGQASRNVNGEALVVLTERRHLHRLNAVGTRIWEICDQRSVAEIVQAVVAEFEVEESVAVRDVCEFLENLQQLGAVEIQTAVGARGGA